MLSQFRCFKFCLMFLEVVLPDPFRDAKKLNKSYPTVRLRAKVWIRN